MSDYIKKNGLIYTEDLKTVVGVDSSASVPFTGRVPFGAHAFEEEAFSECKCESISLPDSADTVGDGLFMNNAFVKKIKIPSNLKKLSPYMFSGCTSLENVSLPLDMNEFTEGLFQNCSRLADIPFRAGIKEVPDNMCEGCASLKSVVFPETVERIGHKAFADCTGLETVVLPAGLYALYPDSFEGCTSIHNVRIGSGNNLLYVGKDGCLYERSVEGDDILLIKVYGAEKQEVSFFKQSVDEDASSKDKETEFFSNEDLNEDDDDFSSEIGVADEELAAVGMVVTSSNDSEDKIIKQEPEKMPENEKTIDSVFADIMTEEKERSQSGSEVAISENELEVLGETMEVMNESTVNSVGARVSNEELENLFEAHESTEEGANRREYQKVEDIPALDSKTQILIDSVEYSRILTFTPKGEVPSDFDLFVVAERLVEDAEGKKVFSEKLVRCCETFARIHDFRRVIMLYGLPVDNEEFMMFYHHFINKRNVILACQAASPSQLSEYGRTICEESRISLHRDEMNEQRKKAGIKNEALIKLVIQDKYI